MPNWIQSNLMAKYTALCVNMDLDRRLNDTVIYFSVYPSDIFYSWPLVRKWNQLKDHVICVLVYWVHNSRWICLSNPFNSKFDDILRVTKIEMRMKNGKYTRRERLHNNHKIVWTEKWTTDRERDGSWYSIFFFFSFLPVCW